MAGGGTGGHVIPALAVARELRARGHEAFFVGTERGMEARLVPAEGFELQRIDIGGLNRVTIRQKAITLLKLPLTTLGCGKFVRASSAIFSMGGYVAGPPVMAALLGRKPVVVMEPNAIPGFTNRVISRFVTRALVSFAATESYFPKGKTETTGLPVREEFFRIPARARGDVLHVLITGGSQGSRTLNQAARASWPLFRKAGFPLRLVHQTGPREHEQLRAAFAESGIEGEIVPFITDMPAAGKPAILVPFPFAADDHQTRNAEAMERGGAARLIPDGELTGDRLFAAIGETSEPLTLEQMARAARQLAKPGAARRAAEILEEVARI
jgi:UDP-N-acetylglucosamine--N-acetylmuramyl-(pentapeptide) pyrophosphoryl-undecaprenol N-acetylglucosamine transferase